jgi:hypothetical protein
MTTVLRDWEWRGVDGITGFRMAPTWSIGGSTKVWNDGADALGRTR